MITCGNCHSKHEDVDGVRNCYAAGKPSSMGASVSGVTNESESLPEFASDPATAKQLEYINALINQRDTDLVAGRAAELMMDVMDSKAISKREASSLISVLKACPGKAVAAANKAHIAANNEVWPSVPAGRYALYRTGADGQPALRFYQVDKPTEGRWAGRVFLSLLIGSPGNYTKLAIKDGRQRDEIMAAIGLDARAAAVEFGRKAGVCGRCLSPLSNLRSRAAGYGAICASKLGWPYPGEEEARRILDELGIDASDLSDDDDISENTTVLADDDMALEPEGAI